MLEYHYMKNTILKPAALNASGTALYVIFVSFFLFYAPQFFGENKEDTVFIPIAMLLLFVLSAAITGFLVIGRPVLWYLDGKKKEAVSLFMTTVGFLFVITLVAFLVMAVFGR